jgi:hypothetical protein
MKKLAGFSFLVVCLALPAAARGAGSTNGSGGDMPAFYDCNPLTINFKPLSSNADVELLRHNGSINTIYMSDTPVNGGMFVPVLDAIQGDGFNPLWQEVDITFNVTPFQLCRDDDVTAAALAGTITLVPTNEVYRCSVVGPKK